MKKIQGAHTAIITPFHALGELNEEGLRENIRFQIQNGINGIVALGTTGETPTLTDREKEKIIRISREETKDKIQLTIGTGCYSTQETIESTQLAYELGADMALVVVPYYNRPTQEGIYRHFKAIAEAVDIPIIIYNVPSRTGQNMLTSTLSRLVQIPNICGVKETSGNIGQISEVIESVRRTNPNFSVVSGDDAITLPLMALGGDGIITPTVRSQEQTEMGIYWAYDGTPNLGTPPR